jgi:U6 snRNA-associated Sm-like protein LSm5
LPNVRLNSDSRAYSYFFQVNLVLDDAVEYSPEGDGLVKTELQSELLLNGNQIAVLVPGGTGPPEDSLAAQAR